MDRRFFAFGITLAVWGTVAHGSVDISCPWSEKKAQSAPDSPIKMEEIEGVHLGSKPHSGDELLFKYSKLENNVLDLLNSLSEEEDIGEAERIIANIDSLCEKIQEPKKSFSEEIYKLVCLVSKKFEKHRTQKWFDLSSSVYIATSPLFESGAEGDSESIDTVEDFWNAAFAAGCIQNGGGVFRYNDESVVVEKK